VYSVKGAIANREGSLILSTIALFHCCRGEQVECNITWNVNCITKDYFTQHAATKYAHIV